MTELKRDAIEDAICCVETYSKPTADDATAQLAALVKRINAQAAALDRVRAAYENRGSNGAFGWQFERAIGDALAAALEHTGADEAESLKCDNCGAEDYIEPVDLGNGVACIEGYGCYGPRVSDLKHDLAAANARVAELEHKLNLAVAASGHKAELLHAANARADAAERESEGRRAVLMQKADEVAIEWRRAERAESERDEWKAKCEAAERKALDAAPAPTERVAAAERAVLDLVVRIVQAGDLFKGSSQRAICEAVSELARRAVAE
jgi:hypothetical protein